MEKPSENPSFARPQ